MTSNGLNSSSTTNACDAGPISSLRQERSNNYVTDLLHWPSTSSTPPTTIVLFIPGNPGLVQYYTPFLSTIHAALGSSTTTIYALGHLDHSSNAKPRFTARGVATLRDQVQHKVEFIDELKENYPNIGLEKGQTRLVLIAHSIGSWISCECIKSRPNLVSSAILLFPTISHMARTPNGRRLWPLFSPLALSPVGVSTALFSYLPQGPLSRVVARLSGQGGPGSQVTTRLVRSPGTVVSALAMAREEMNEVKDLDTAFLERFGDRLWWYWAREDDDGWVLPSSVKEIQETLDRIGVAKDRRRTCEEGMQHAFILTSKHSESLAKRCAGWISQQIAEASEP